MLKVALIGCGFIGNALKVWLEANNPNIKLYISDPAKGYNDDVYNITVDAYFIQIHVPTLMSGEQDMVELINIVKKLPPNVDCWIRTTILPSNIKLLKNINPLIHHMPEFLTERTSIDDFKKQSMIFTGNIELLKKIFLGKKYLTMSSYEAALAKYAHNVFGALKVTYFNCINEICKHNEYDFLKVRDGILMSGYISDTHTQVPGPDGKFGYGGKCFPKDVNAFEQEFRYSSIEQILNSISRLNQDFRNG